ncbi:caspase family protein [Nonomuraea zeae]|uniref:Caspase family protein n=1 Tax=Nonomuraea zeae TaxID=1642303 RepID=A0A5S4GMA3_9ACTN|nr:caspase family protein [Nonomuraea zeae]TMR34075.1 caspase family protein [Nonomuraea zeae]
MNVVPDPSRSRVALIGTARYDLLPALASVEDNLLSLAEVLTAHEVWGLPAAHVAIVPDPLTSADLLDPVVRAADEATDTVVLYYAGHGLIDHLRGDLHLALVGSDSQRMYTAVAYAHIRDALLGSRATRRIVILDCCYSGRALGTMADPITAAVDEASAEGTYVLAATAENQKALAPAGESHTAFTAELLRIFQNGIDGRGPLLDLDTIYNHVRAVMRGKGRPIPQKRDRNTAGQLTLIRNRAYASHSAPVLPQQPPPVTSAQLRTGPSSPPLIRSRPRPSTSPATNDQGLEREFHAAMVEVYKRAKKEAGYPATYFLKMISERGGLASARHLLCASSVSDGFTALWERNRLDLSVEAVVLQSRFASLFTEDEREQARARLEEYGYVPPDPPRTEAAVKSQLVQERDFDAAYHVGGPRAAEAKCSWHGSTCDDEVVASVLVRDRGGETWHAVCQRALHKLRASRADEASVRSSEP